MFVFFFTYGFLKDNNNFFADFNFHERSVILYSIFSNLKEHDGINFIRSNVLTNIICLRIWLEFYK